MNYAITPPDQCRACITLPASKSIAARALVIDALCHSACTLTGLTPCDDTSALVKGLSDTRGMAFVGASGTALRLLTAFHAAMPGHDIVIDGLERLRQRPVAPLVDALRQLGAQVRYLNQEGFAPLAVEGRTLHGGHITLPGHISSQFATALMLIGPLLGGLTITLTGHIASRPYIDLTANVMRHFGVDARWLADDTTIVVPPGEYAPTTLHIEGDWSAASYWLALQALMPHSHFALQGLDPHSWQGDSRMLTFMQQMGMNARWNAQGVLEADMSRTQCCCCSTFADLSGTPDLAPTLTLLLCLLGRPFRLTGTSTLPYKESHRAEALRHELARLGYVITLEGNEAISWHFATCAAEAEPRIDTHGDHRLAMAFALAATRHPGIIITHAETVEKSYPQFWNHLSQAGFTLTAVP